MSKPHLCILGVSGLLGGNLAFESRETYRTSGFYHTHKFRCSGVQTTSLDMTDSSSVRDALFALNPDILINCVALTNVDSCQEDPESAVALNVSAAKIAAEVASTMGARLVHISTDHVFDGIRGNYSVTDHPSPVNKYAETKLEAETAVRETDPESLIIRTNFYGSNAQEKTSFSEWILDGLLCNQELSMFNDVYFTPILVTHLVSNIMNLVEQDASGLFHVGGSERISKYEFARRLAKLFSLNESDIQPTSVATAQFNAPRPRDMSLDCTSTTRYLGHSMPDVDIGLKTWRRFLENGSHLALKSFCKAGTGTRIRMPSGGNLL